jgi:hypothetical protein
MNAHAYTVGNNVVFGAGKFALGTRPGQRLIAYELAHTLQHPLEMWRCSALFLHSLTKCRWKNAPA